MTEHSQKFRLLGKRLGVREWLGIQHMKEGVDYERFEPRIVDHLPPGEWLFTVIGEGNEYTQCEICGTPGREAVDNLGQAGKVPS